MSGSDKSPYKEVGMHGMDASSNPKKAKTSKKWKRTRKEIKSIPRPKHRFPGRTLGRRKKDPFQNNKIVCTKCGIPQYLADLKLCREKKDN